jgi:hypothetical protein
LFQAGKLLARRIMDRLAQETARQLLTQIGVGDVPEDEDEEPDLLRMIKSSPGGVSLPSLREPPPATTPTAGIPVTGWLRTPALTTDT